MYKSNQLWCILWRNSEVTHVGLMSRCIILCLWTWLRAVNNERKYILSSGNAIVRKNVYLNSQSLDSEVRPQYSGGAQPTLKSTCLKYGRMAIT